MQPASKDDAMKRLFPGLDHFNDVPTLSNQISEKPLAFTFQNVLDYKLYPCENAKCPYYPRTTVPNNQYLEKELMCPYYHHFKDMRRPPISNVDAFNGDFAYQANYYKHGKSSLSRERYSQNFFESLFHPLYYKQFDCRREFCEKSIYCPYYHSTKEKTEWEIIFEQNLSIGKKTFQKPNGGQPTNQANEFVKPSQLKPDDTDSSSNDTQSMQDWTNILNSQTHHQHKSGHKETMQKSPLSTDSSEKSYDLKRIVVKSEFFDKNATPWFPNPQINYPKSQ